jgi:hypothetical protein
VKSLEQRNALIARIMPQYDDPAGDGPPAVELDEFFEGNWDEHSIAPNQVGDGRPALSRVWEVLRAVRQRPEVERVLVGIHECPESDQEADFDMWPAAENVYIYTTAASGEVETWVSELEVDGVGEGWPYGKPRRGAGAVAGIPRPGAVLGLKPEPADEEDGRWIAEVLRRLKAAAAWP